jgi:undecaprenyl-diphosphatase
LVGFAALNQTMRGLIGDSGTWYTVTELMGYAALGVVALLGLMGLIQLVQRKSLRKVDAALLVTGAYFVLVLAIYVLFDKVVINCRPVLEDGKLEASYPSSHTVLALCVMGAAALLAGRWLKGRALGLVRLGCVLFMAVMVIGRLLSGVHWFTDILGGILLSAALISLYARALRIFAPEKRNG